MPAERIGSLWVIASGLKAGEKIIVEGLQKARAGSKVKPTLVELNEKGEVPAEKQEAPPEKKDAAPGKAAPAKPGEKH
jgi:membrane fusion protein (multidrug efflux system)